MTTVEDIAAGVESLSPWPPTARLAFRLSVASSQRELGEEQPQ